MLQCVGLLAAVVLLAEFSILSPPATTRPSDALFAPISDPALPNARRVTARVICGGQPDGPRGFRDLQSMGVKTIISVDGITPDVELAHKYGMRYVHLPFGYNGVPEAQGEAIAKAIEEMPGPIYLHCHHGQHRGPAAAAVACVYNGTLPPQDAQDVLKTFGTGANYKGLWRSARDARPKDPQVLRSLKVEFVERAKVPPLAQAMIAVDHTLDRLKLLQKSSWQSPPDQPDLEAAHEALQLEELLVEIGRSGSVKGRPAQFGRLLSDAQQAATAFHKTLVGTPNSSHTADAAFMQVGNACTRCHAIYRD